MLQESKLRKVLIVIPARLKSARLPKKLLLDLHGRPLLYWTVKRVLETNIADVIVATDSHDIQAMCQNYGFPVTLTSNKCLNGTERVYEIAVKQRYKYELFMNVQGDEPLIEIDILKTMLKTIGNYDESFKIAISKVCDAQKNNPSEVKVALSGANRVRFASRALIPFSRDGTELYYKIHGVYLYTFNILEKFINSPQGPLEAMEKVEQLRCIENDIPLFGIITPHTQNSVDTESDLQFYRGLNPRVFQANL